MTITNWILGVGAAALLLSPTAFAEPTERDVREILKRDFRAKGQAKMDRMESDAVQRVCTLARNNPPAGVAKALESDQMKTIAFPTGSLVGDWKKGEAIAWSGRGMQWNENPAKPAGGGCYNCHELSPKRTSFGTIGPSLKGFGKVRGSGPDMQRYVYGKIYNPKAYTACSEMPRFGHSGTLSEAQIKDLVGLLLDPKSPVNQ
jgi:sulfur-oxidizing protein SoxX